MKEWILASLLESSHNCIECVKAKLTKTKKKWLTHNPVLLEIIRTDICKHFPTITLNGFKYFIFFIDDNFMYVYVSLIANCGIIAQYIISDNLE